MDRAQWSKEEEGGADLGWDPPLIIMMESHSVNLSLRGGLRAVVRGDYLLWGKTF